MRARSTRRRRVALTLPQHFALLSYGFGPDGAPFASVDDARAAWEEHRAELIARCEPGTRPLAWWWLEPGIPPELRADDPAELIDAREWVSEPDARPQVELPAPTPQERAARREADARALRLEHRRRAWLATKETP